MRANLEISRLSLMLLQKLFSRIFNSSMIEQKQSESLLAICTLAYQIDGKFSLEEQKVVDDLIEQIPWHSQTLVKTFHSKVISDSRDAISTGEVEQFVLDHADALRGASNVLEVIRELIASDGEVSDSEAELLKTLEASLS